MSNTIRIRTTPNDGDKYLKCPYCESDKLIKAGKHKWTDINNNIKHTQRYRCKLCIKRFNFHTNKDTSHNRDILLYDKIIDLYVNKNMLVSDISHKLSFHVVSIRRILKRYNITKRNKIEEIIRGITGLDYQTYLIHTKNLNNYKRIVNQITRNQPLKTLSNFDKRGITGTQGVYQLDHKYSIKQGFIDNISPLIIGNISNLEFIPWEENNKKRSKCSVKINDIGK